MRNRGPRLGRSASGAWSALNDGKSLASIFQGFLLVEIQAVQPLREAPDGHSYRCGQQAALALADHVGQRIVVCEPRDTDRYGRIVAVCHLGAEDLNAWLVAQCWAIAYRRYSTDYVCRRDRGTNCEAGHLARTVRIAMGMATGPPAAIRLSSAPWDWRCSDRAPYAGVTAGE